MSGFGTAETTVTTHPSIWHSPISRELVVSLVISGNPTLVLAPFELTHLQRNTNNGLGNN
jgi:hypothetical protein